MGSFITPIFIGRNQQVSQLASVLVAVQGGAGRCVLVSGEAGIGKSRLITEIHTRATGNGFTVLTGRCFEQDRSFPYAPLIDLLRPFFAQGSVADRLEALGPLAAELVKLLPELASNLSVSQSAPPLESEVEKRRLFEALTGLFLRQAEAGPLLLIVEDLHWSDQASLEFLLYVVRRLAEKPIFLLLSSRSRDAPAGLDELLAGLDREPIAQEIRLDPLNCTEVGQLLKAILDQPQELSAEFVQTIYTLTEGNPFYAEEICTSLIASGDVYYADNQWRQKPLSQIDIPDSVQRLVQQRLGRISRPARELIDLAAVSGRSFDFTVLQALTGHSDSELLVLIKELMTAQLVIEESADRFAFRHALTREAIYSDLLVRERQALHRAIVETMVQLYGDSARLESYLPDLAYHFYEAGIWDRALEYAQRAGDKALSLDTPQAAIGQFSRALDAVRRGALEPQPKLFHRRGQAYEALGDFEQARADYEMALHTARRIGNRQDEWQALLGLGLLWESRDYAQAGNYYQQGLALVQMLEDSGLLARNLNRISNWHLNSGQPHKAMRYYHEALAIFERLADRRHVAETLTMLGTASFSGGDLVQGTVYLERALALFRQLNDRAGVLNTLVHLTLHSSFLTEVWGVTSLAELVRGGEEAVQIARKSGWRSDEAHALIRLAECLIRQGDYPSACEAVQTGLTIAQEIEHGEWLCDAHYILGSLLLDLFAVPEAQQHLEQSLALSREIGSGLMVYVVSSRLAEAYLVQAKFAQAEAVLNQALAPEVLPRTGLERDVWRVRAELALAQGEAERALQISNHLIASAVNVEKYETGCIPSLWKLRGEALSVLEQWPEAEADLQAAQTFARRQGIKSLLWRIYLALGQLYRTQKRHPEADRAFTTTRSMIGALVHDLPDIPAVRLPATHLRDNFLRQAMAPIPSPTPLTPRQAAKKEYDGLTRREREVAVLIAEGKSNRDIAAALVIGERTATTHVSNILNKLGFTSRAQIAAWAVEKGLVQPPSA